MIRRLQRRMTLLVLMVILLVTVGIVAAISLANYRSIEQNAQNTLQVLVRSRGQRPAHITIPLGDDDDERGQKPLRDLDGTRLPARGRQRFQPGQPMITGEDSASLSNSYTAVLAADGTVASWSSDRAELYSDEQVRALAEQAVSAGKDCGRIGTQFYSLTEQEDERLLVVLDARLEMESARRVLLIAAATGAAAFVLLGLMAMLLIRRMVRPVEEAFDRQRQFVWDASHELKTPLAVISANAQVLEGEIGENEALRYIRSEVDRSDKLVGSLLGLARMERGEVVASKQRMDLSRAALSVALPFESSAFEVGRELVTDVQEGVTILGDEAMLRQLVVILLDNALKYGSEGGVIRVILRRSGRGAELSVANTGEPIAEADLPRLFDRFYRADASRSRETGGNGLGLAIAKSIADAHGAKLTCMRDAARGENVFTLALPG